MFISTEGSLGFQFSTSLINQFILLVNNLKNVFDMTTKKLVTNTRSKIIIKYHNHVPIQSKRIH